VKRTDYSVAYLCQHYGVSRSGYSAWLHRPESRRAKDNRQLITQITSIHKRSHETYGSPRITAALNRRGIHCGENRIARLMREQHISVKFINSIDIAKARIDSFNIIIWPSSWMFIPEK